METMLLAMLVTGFASGVHCAGMCGGFVGAFATARVIRFQNEPRKPAAEWCAQLTLSAGRIASYTVAGALAGAAGGVGVARAQALPVQAILLMMANVVLILAGLYIAGAGRTLARFDALGAPLWRLLQPAAARLLKARSLSSTFGAGLLWGWLPCGLVYGALAAATLAGSASRGAATMLAFGLGTLPNLLAIGIAAARMRGWAGAPAVRLVAGALLLGLGVYGLARNVPVALTVHAAHAEAFGANRQ